MDLYVIGEDKEKGKYRLYSIDTKSVIECDSLNKLELEASKGNLKNAKINNNKLESNGNIPDINSNIFTIIGYCKEEPNYLCCVDTLGKETWIDRERCKELLNNNRLVNLVKVSSLTEFKDIERKEDIAFKDFLDSSVEYECKININKSEILEYILESMNIGDIITLKKSLYEYLKIKIMAVVDRGQDFSKYVGLGTVKVKDNGFNIWALIEKKGEEEIRIQSLTEFRYNLVDDKILKNYQTDYLMNKRIKKYLEV